MEGVADTYNNISKAVFNRVPCDNEFGSHRLIETKGREDLGLAHKDRAAALWCDNATTLTGTNWSYLKVPQEGFRQLQPDQFADLTAFELGSFGERMGLA